MNLFARLFRRDSGKQEDEAVLVYLDGKSLPDEVYEDYDVSTLEDDLVDAISEGSLGEFDGNEFGPEGVTLFAYGPDAEALFSGIEGVLRSYPLCQNARVVIRKGGPGAPEREVRLPQDG